MQKKERNIIIILIAAIIVVLGVLVGIILLNHRDVLPKFGSTQTTQQTTSISDDALEGIMRQQPLFVSGIQYYYKGSQDRFKHDAMGASVFNSSDVNIKSFVVSFCAFDADGNPIKIKQPGESSEGGYIRTITYEYAKAKNNKTMLAPNETCEDILMYVNSTPQIVTVKACVKSYVSTEDISWDNPYYNTFTEHYAGKMII